MCAAPLLSIAVPTYDRFPALERLVESIARERTGALRDRVEVVISDNASRDATATRGPELAERVSARFVRQPRNLGFEGNVERLLDLVTGQYVWIMGDDDRLAPGSVARITSVLAQGAADFLVVPDAVEDEPPERNVAARYGVRQPLCAPLGEFLGAFGLFGVLGGIGHAVFRRSKLGGRELYGPMGTRFPHVFMLAHSFAEETALFLPETAFIVPRMSAEEGEAYRRRWAEEGLWIEGWLGCMRATLALFEKGKLAAPVPQSFFRMMIDQTWPLHYHVYNALARKLFVEGAPLDAVDWEAFAKFDGLLGAKPYTQRLTAIYHTAMVRVSVAETCLQLVDPPHPIYGT